MFNNDQQINIFLTLDDEFVNSNIDTDITLDFDYTDKVEVNEVEDENIDNFHPTKFTKLDIQNLKKMEIDEAIDEESEVINLKDNLIQTMSLKS